MFEISVKVSSYRSSKQNQPKRPVLNDASFIASKSVHEIFRYPSNSFIRGICTYDIGSETIRQFLILIPSFNTVTEMNILKAILDSLLEKQIQSWQL